MGTDGPTPEAKLNMSLDALIAQDRKKEPQNGAANGRPTQGRGRGQQNRGRSNGQGRGFPQGRGNGQYQYQEYSESNQPFRNGSFRGRGGRGNGQRFVSEGGFRPQHQRPPFPEGTIIFPGFPLPFGSMAPGMPPMFMTEQMFGRQGFQPQIPKGDGNLMQQRHEPSSQPKPSTPAPVPSARLDEETGEVTVRLKGKIILKVSKSGLITLNTDGMRTAILFMALNAVLNTVGISITRPQNNDEWSIQDGRSLTRFRDGVTIPGRGPQSLQRGPKILTAFGGTDPDAAAAATLASNAAAEAAGIVLKRKGDARQQQKPGGGEPPSKRLQSSGTPGTQEASASSGRNVEDADKVRRLMAKGRYIPS